MLLLTALSGSQAQDNADSVLTSDLETSLAPAALPPAPVTELKAFDSKNDHGHSVTLNWRLSPDDGAGKNIVFAYEVYRWVPFFMDSLKSVREKLSQTESAIAELEVFEPPAKHLLNMHREGKPGKGFADSVKFYEDTLAASKRLLPEYRQQVDRLRDERDEGIDRIPSAHTSYPSEGEWRKVGTVVAGESRFENVGVKDKESADYLADNTPYYYRVDAVTVNPAVRSQSDVVGPVRSSGQWFNTGRVPVFVAVMVFGFLTVYFITRAKRGIDLYVRPLAGIDAVDDAIGRATEMGKPILYVLGLGTAADIATIASFTILGRVARRVAEYQTQLIVPCYDPIVMTVAQETVKAGFSDAGRPEAYNEDIVYFVTQSQFAYVAAVNGVMLRQLPATNVYMGRFYAESLILAETGALAGSIQIAGTDEIAQIPFFIVACDFTLIGEELYAASAYLGREPLLLGSLKAQDYAKAAVIALATAGIVAANLDWTWFTTLFRVSR
ncbi:MAG TPA: DUF6754 domain-containing protein [Candidatus Deferrimicrobium sp.]|nr:DUF6754 domain-containing protein [Candidatus Deferrimicrobium sp.]